MVAWCFASSSTKTGSLPKGHGIKSWIYADWSSVAARADSSNDFMFGSGPSRHYIGESGRAPRGINGQTTLPCGESGELGRWLTNDYYDIRQRNRDVKHSKGSTQKFVPPGDDDNSD